MGTQVRWAQEGCEMHFERERAFTWVTCEGKMLGGKGFLRTATSPDPNQSSLPIRPGERGRRGQTSRCLRRWARSIGGRRTTFECLEQTILHW